MPSKLSVPALVSLAILGSSPALAWVSSSNGARYTCGGTGPENFYSGAVCGASVDGIALTSYTSTIAYTDTSATSYNVAIACNYGSAVCSYSASTGSGTVVGTSSNPAGCPSSMNAFDSRKKRDYLAVSCAQLGKGGASYLAGSVVEGTTSGTSLQCNYIGTLGSNSEFDCVYSSSGGLASGSGATAYCPTSACGAYAGERRHADEESGERKRNGVLKVKSRRNGKARTVTMGDDE